MKKYNLVIHTDDKHINIATDIDLDDHLKRHLKEYVKTKTTDWIMKWLHDRGISNEIDTKPLIRSD